MFLNLFAFDLLKKLTILNVACLVKNQQKDVQIYNLKRLLKLYVLNACAPLQLLLSPFFSFLITDTVNIAYY